MREGDPGTGTPRGPPDSPLLRDSRRGNHTPLEGLVGWLQNVLHSHNRGRRGGEGEGRDLLILSKIAHRKSVSSTISVGGLRNTDDEVELEQIRSRSCFVYYRGTISKKSPSRRVRV